MERGYQQWSKPSPPPPPQNMTDSAIWKLFAPAMLEAVLEAASLKQVGVLKKIDITYIKLTFLFVLLCQNMSRNQKICHGRKNECDFQRNQLFSGFRCSIWLDANLYVWVTWHSWHFSLYCGNKPVAQERKETTTAKCGEAHFFRG